MLGSPKNLWRPACIDDVSESSSSSTQCDDEDLDDDAVSGSDNACGLPQQAPPPVDGVVPLGVYQTAYLAAQLNVKDAQLASALQTWRSATVVWKTAVIERDREIADLRQQLQASRDACNRLRSDTQAMAQDVG